MISNGVLTIIHVVLQLRALKIIQICLLLYNQLTRNLQLFNIRIDLFVGLKYLRIAIGNDKGFVITTFLLQIIDGRQIVFLIFLL